MGRLRLVVRFWTFESTDTFNDKLRLSPDIITSRAGHPAGGFKH